MVWDAQLYELDLLRAAYKSVGRLLGLPEDFSRDDVDMAIYNLKEEVKNLRKALELKPITMIVTTEELEALKKDFGVENNG
jgi:hypothetical protein